MPEYGSEIQLNPSSPSIKFVSQSRRDRNVPTIVVIENVTTTDRRDFPVPYGRMKYSIMPLRQILDEKFMLGLPASGKSSLAKMDCLFF